jgi:hypothetical protein
MKRTSFTFDISDPTKNNFSVLSDEDVVSEKSHKIRLNNSDLTFSNSSSSLLLYNFRQALLILSLIKECSLLVSGLLRR